MLKKLRFLSDYEVNKLIVDNPGREIILWGSGFISDAIFQTLLDKGVKISYWGDSNPKLAGKKKSGIKILSIKEIQNHKDAIVFISSYGYVPIYRMLIDEGVRNVYALRDVYKYPLKELEADRDYLQSFNYSRKSGNILLELYGNIGDVIIRIGIVQKFIYEFGRDKIYLLFNDEKHSEIYRLITDNVICITKDDLCNQQQRRLLLRKINELAFEKSFILCDVRLIALHRIINSFNSNILETIFCNEVPDNEYLPEVDVALVCNYYGWAGQEHMTGWGKLERKFLQRVNDVLKDFLGKYVVINLGASKKVRQYNPKNFCPVIKWINEKNFKVVLIGAGEYDLTVASVLKKEIGAGFVDFTSKISLPEAALIISKSEFFVGTDSAMSHLAYIVGKPSIVIMGGGEYGSFMHRDGLVKYISVEDKACFGCKWYCDKTDDFGRAKCVYDIKAEAIIEGIKECMNQ